MRCTLQHPTENRWIMLIVASVLSAFFLAALTGCPVNPDLVHNSTPAVGSAINKADSHVGSAEALVQQAKPEASKTGQALLEAASKEHKAASTELHTAAQENAAAQVERGQLVDAAHAAKAAELKAEGTLGYRIQVWLIRFAKLVILLVAVHYLGKALSILPPPYGPICGLVGTLVNPLAWAEYVAGRIHLSRCQKSAGQGSFTLPPPI